MTRQHTRPIYLAPGEPSVSLLPVGLAGGSEAFSEADLQRLIHRHPECLPIGEIDSLFADPVPVCMELATPAGSIDNFMVTASGLPVLVECKLWRNPEGRREVVGQILDYAKELARWTSSDLQREASRRTGREGNALLQCVRDAGHEADEITFNDNLSRNLRRGRFLLLIVGDGIREGVEAIASYLQGHTGLHFTLGLVEMPIFRMPGGSHLVAPRVLARTETILRTVIEVPEGYLVAENPEASTESPAHDEIAEERLAFWRTFVAGLSLDDPDQAIPKATRQGSIYAPLPKGVWLTIYRMMQQNALGVYVSYSRGSPGERKVLAIVAAEGPRILDELGGTARIGADKIGRTLIQDERVFRDLSDAGARVEAIAWLRTRVNDFVNAVRPRLKATIADEEPS
ncbi:MAG: hypothetical protein WDN44_12745 [Sphingomonas sp.]